MDILGPVPILTLSSSKTENKPSQLLVLGTSTLVHNSFVSSGTANGDFFLNAIAFLVDEEAQINQRANDDEVKTLRMNIVQGILVWFICLVISPGAILIGAISAWREKDAH